MKTTNVKEGLNNNLGGSSMKTTNVKEGLNNNLGGSSMKTTYLEDFLTKLDRLFAQYKKDGIFEGYSRIGSNRMIISEEAHRKDCGYMWSAIDGAIWMYNQEHPEAMITVDECVPCDGIVTFEFRTR